jgi:cytochrome c oxidase assembly factor CtaG
MQWWCSATATPWSWTPVLYPGVWLVTLTLALAYWRVSQSAATPPAARAAGWVAVVLVELALDWPVGTLAAGYLASAHAAQFLVLALVAPPLLLLGARHGVAAWWARNADTRRVLLLGWLASPFPAVIAFNLIVVSTHVPRVNDTLMPLQSGAMLVDMAWLISGIWFWWPLVVRLPHLPRFVVPLRLLYLFFGTLIHTGIGMVMLVRDFPMYAVYELAPRATGLSALSDLKVAGGIMELGGGAIVFGILTVMFFRWSGGVGAERG